MVPVSNEFLSDGSVIRSQKENGSCSLNGASVLPRKWKPRTVSAVRDFPRGCGPIVQPVNVVSREANASSSLVNNNGMDIVGVKDAGTSTIQVESSINDVSKYTDGRVGLFVEPHKVEMEALGNKELQNGDNQAVVKEEVSGPVNAVVQVDDVKLLSPTQGTVNGSSVIKGAVPKIKFPRRRVSAVRDFPPYCGLNAADPTEEERIRINGKRSFGAEDKGGGRDARSTEAVVVGGEEPNGFPPYCGLNAADPMEKERIRINRKRSFGAEDKGGGRDARSTEAVVVGGEEANGFPPYCGLKRSFGAEDKGGGRDARSTEAVVVGGEEPNGFPPYCGLKRSFAAEDKGGGRDARSTEAVVVGTEEPNSFPHCGLNAADSAEEERIRINGKRSFGAEDKGGGRDARSTEAVVVGGKEPNGSVKNEFLQKTQSDELRNASPMANQETGATVTVLPLKGLVGDEAGVGGERSTEKMIVGGEESKVDVQDGEVLKFEHDVIGVEPNKKLHTVSQKGDRAITGEASREIVVYSRDKVLKRRVSVDAHGEDSKGKFLDESVQNSETQEMVAIPNDRSLGPIQKNSKNISGQLRKVGHEKCLKKRPLDDTNDLRFMGGERRLVLGLMAPLCPRGSAEEDLTNANDSTRSKAKVHASVTPKKSRKRKAGYGEKVVGEKSSSTGKVAYTGTLDLVVRDEEDFVVDTEEQKEDSPPSQGPYDVDVTLPPFGPKSSSDIRNKVRETLRLFQALCRKLLQGEEAKTRDGDGSTSGVRGKRIDYEAIRLLKEKGKEHNLGEKTFGTVPGVEIGDEFQYRVELALVGIHRLYQAGIDYIKQGRDVFAVSVVASRGYDNDLDKPDCLTYSGSGGMGKDKQVENQKLERGNLALKNNIFHKHPVRVIRGYKGKATESSDSKSKAAITYIYDGLYTVDRCWQEPGPRGNLVFRFELRRIPGQPELALREVKKSKKLKIREGLCVDDITGGNEVFRICAINTIDNEKPPSLNYITKMIYPDWYRPVPPKGCNCVGRCSDKRCSCAFKNGGEIPYNHNGAIVEAKPLVYECGPSCRCPPTCYNRVTQHGMKIQLEIFKTESKGWGVRSLSSISSGSFICEYIGELLEDTEAEKRTGNDEYLFDIGKNYNDCSLNPDIKSSSSEIVDAGGFTIDAANYGNVSRFINHSCCPNLYAQNVLYDEEDKRMPHIMLFAAENIPPLQELTYHYNYAVDTVHDSDGNIKVKNCYCGSSECTGRLY